MNQIFVLYDLRDTSVEDSMRSDSVSAELMVEEQKYFCEFLAMQRMRQILSAYGYTATPKRLTVMKCYENTPKLREFIIENVRECIKEMRCADLVNVVIEETTLDKYIEISKKSDWIYSPKVRVIVQPLPHSKGSWLAKNQATLQTQLAFMLGDQFDVQVLGARMAITEGLINIPIDRG